MSDPKSRITWSISYSPICVVNLISLHVLILCFSIFWTTCSSPIVIVVHLLMCSCNPLTTLLSHSSFIHVSRNIVSIDGSISDSSLSLLLEVEASVKLFLASIKVSQACSKSTLQIKLFFVHQSLANPSTLFRMVAFIISRHNSTSEHNTHIKFFLASTSSFAGSE